MNRVDYTIGEPLNELPGGGRSNMRHWAVLTAATNANGAWVPVECQDEIASRAVAVAMRAERHGGKFEASVRGKICYVRLCPKAAA